MREHLRSDTTNLVTGSFLLAVFVLFAPTRVSAQNLAGSNPEFNVAIAPWKGGIGQVSSWSSDDADSCPLSGSFSADAVVGSTSSSAGVASLEACIVVNEGDHIFQEIAYKSTAPTVTLNAWVYDNATCSGFVRSNGLPEVLTPSVGWSTGRRELVFTGLGGPTSVSFGARASDDTPTPFTVGFDRIYFGKVDRVFTDDFEGGSTCRWSDTQPHS